MTRHGEEVAADHLAARIQGGLAVVCAAAIDLVLIDGDADDVRARVRRDGAHGPPDAATDVELAVPRARLQEVRDALLVDARRLAVGAVGRWHVAVEKERSGGGLPVPCGGGEAPLCGGGLGGEEVPRGVDAGEVDPADPTA